MSQVYEPAPTFQRARAPEPERRTERLTGWMWVWIIIGILVVLVVVGFLIGIVRALESIDAALADTTSAVTGAGGDVVPLPGYVNTVTDTLVSINGELQPIGDQAEQIRVALTDVRDSLSVVDNSLKDTSGTLVGTSGTLVTTSGLLVDTSGRLVSVASSLVDTSNVAGNILRLATDIKGTLVEAQRRESLGTNEIWRRVIVANDALVPAEADARNILGGLRGTDLHLESICAALSALPHTDPRC